MRLSLEYMELRSENLILQGKYKMLWHSAYWVMATLLLFLVFSNRNYDITIRMLVALIITFTSLGVSYIINYFLIPRFLFSGKYFRFFYYLGASVLVSMWISYLSIIFIVWYASLFTKNLKFPNNTDVILLLSGSYIIILFAAIIHFIKETYTRQLERDRMARQKSEAELKLKEMRLKLLQGQLHPHFLFNMLNNIYGLWMENSRTTPDVILKLSGLLDFMLYECNNEMIPLHKEVHLIKNYIDLEMLRHDSRLLLELDLPKDDINWQITPLILFAFVENAFKHGANRSSSSCHISISLKQVEHALILKVANSYSETATVDINNVRGIGLKNVKERLDILYPNRHQLDIVRHNGVYEVLLVLEKKQLV